MRIVLGNRRPILNAVPDISTVNVSKQNGVSIKPVASYKRVFDTPIQQLVAGPLDQDHLLAIRTYAATHFLRLKKSFDQPTWEIESGPRLAVEETNNREVVDIKLRFDRALAVSDLGSLYTTRPFSHKPEVKHVCDMSAMELKDPNFWRLAWDLDPNSGFVVSSDNLSTLDLRVCHLPSLMTTRLITNRVQIALESTSSSRLKLTSSRLSRTAASTG